MPQETDPRSSNPQHVGVPPRFQQGPLTTALQLGALAFLNGSWKGKGFNAIWRPHNQNSDPVGNATKRFLELNLTDDSFHFQAIPGVVPNRGLDPQNDLSLYGLHYLQRVSDRDPAPPPGDPQGYSQTAGQALHIEPGLFMLVPASMMQAPPGDTPLVYKKSIVRMGSVPHGTTVLMQGPSPDSTPKPGKPHIPKLTPFTGYPGVNAASFPPYTAPPPVPPGPNPPGMGIQPVALDGGPHFVPEVNIALDTLVPPSLSSGPFPEHFQDFVDDPNSELRHAIRDQDILGHIEIHLTTDTLSADGKPTGGIGSLYETVSNIPFLGVATRTPTPPPLPSGMPAPPAPSAFQPAPIPNAFVYSASATFWIEWVRNPGGPTVPLHQGPGRPAGPIVELEPFWEHSTHLQLQYSQLVILIFNGVLWPHVTVATMRLSDG
jgi:hypothetical protein